MAKFHLNIKLLSDLCVSDGGVYNSIIDTDCCHDEAGFPFIPAKRIKGCLRECALELNEWGKHIDICGIFGEEGRSDKGAADKRAALRIGNAYLEGFEAMCEEAAIHHGHVLFHPQQILNCFTSLRTQTSISQETGIADPHSLRTMRVANKGLVFTADVEMPTSAFESVKACCAVFQQMGIARTRGFGDVEVTLSAAEQSGADSANTAASPGLLPHADFLDYEIRLEEPLICKSIAGGEARTLDYIEGSKILGLILERIRENMGGQSAVNAFLEDEALRCSNAYIGCGGERFTEVPAYIYSIKNNKEDYVDQRYHRQVPEGIQLSQMKHCYVRKKGKDLFTLDVSVEERYHHRRPDDKSIGRAVSKDDGSNFYQMSSIMAGQRFYGRIYGTERQVETAYTCLAEKESAFLGYGRSAEYGKSRIRIISTGSSKDDGTDNCVSGTELVVRLNAPAIIYNEKAMCSVDREDLLEEILSSLRISKSDLLEYEIYVNFTTLGGFNVTWGRRKPVVPAFDKGTAVCIKLNRSVTVPSEMFLGERCMEGYGEAAVTGPDADPQNGPAPDSGRMQYGDYLECATSLIRSGSIISCDPISYNHPLPVSDKGQHRELQIDEIKIASGSLGEKLADRMFLTWLGASARENVQDAFTAKPEKYRPTVSNLLTGLDGYTEISQVEKMVVSRYGKKSSKKEEKLRYAQEILDKAKDEFGESKERFCKEHGIAGWDWPSEAYDRYQLTYLRELLVAMKLKIRSTIIEEQEE